MEFHLALDYALLVRGRRGGVLSESHSDAQHLVAAEIAAASASADVGVYALGRSDHAAAGSCAGGVARLALGVCRLGRAGFRLGHRGLLLLAVTRIENTSVAMIAMGLASFCSDLTMPISWNACVEIGRRYAATTSGAMNMFGNFAGFVAPVGGGLILARSAGDWNVLLYLMVGASLAAATCWQFPDPEKRT
jgi:hypothetical protein